MSIPSTVNINSPMDTTSLDKVHKNLQILIKKFETWTGIEDPEIGEALIDLCSNLSTEINKFQALVYTAIEKDEGIEKSKQVELITFIKKRISSMWHDMEEKQKIGVDKLGIVIRKHISTDNILTKKHGKESNASTKK